MSEPMSVDAARAFAQRLRGGSDAAGDVYHTADDAADMIDFLLNQIDELRSALNGADILLGSRAQEVDTLRQLKEQLTDGLRLAREDGAQASKVAHAALRHLRGDATRDELLAALTAWNEHRTGHA